jgi:biopolymer transport protein ExbB
MHAPQIVGRIVLTLMLACCWQAELAPAQQVGSVPAEVRQPPQRPEVGPNALREADAAALAEAALAGSDTPATAATNEPAEGGGQQLNVLDLFFKGGVLMYPIVFMSFLVVAFSIERALALRRRRIIPPQLLRELQNVRTPGGFDPRAALRVCEHCESVLSRVMRAALIKLGRPGAEIQQAINDACQREGTKMYKNVRPINLAITITPLMGLLGTVQGMIQAFFVTSVSPVGVNKAQSLAAGIYTALVTTFAGLAVAIPAAILAHYFEGKIQSLLGEIEEYLGTWLPQFERYEGKARPGRAEAPAASIHEPPRVPAEMVTPRLKTAATSD